MKQKFGFIKRQLIKVELYHCERFRTALLIFHGGNSTFINSFDKPVFFSFQCI